jgi:hypothetical protein
MLTGAVIIVAVAIASTAGFLVVSKWVPDRWLIADGDAAGALYATIGVVYAIFIAIAAIAVWEPHDNANQATVRETGDLSEAYWSAHGLAGPDTVAIRGMITAYTQVVVDEEWASLKEYHEPNPIAENLFAQLRTRTESVIPADDSQSQFYDDVLSHINDAADARRARLAAANDGMPALLWPTLIVSSAVNICFLYLFGLDRTFPNGLMMATVGGMIALVLFVIYQVEFPFSRGLGVSPASFSALLSTLGAPT